MPGNVPSNGDIATNTVVSALERLIVQQGRHTQKQGISALWPQGYTQASLPTSSLKKINEIFLKKLKLRPEECMSFTQAK